MKYLTGIPVVSGDIQWNYMPDPMWNREEGIRVAFDLHTHKKQQRREALKTIANIIEQNELKWIIPGIKEWIFGLDILKAQFEQLQDVAWLSGKVRISPEYEPTEREVFKKIQYESIVAFYLVPTELEMIEKNIADPPIEIGQSLEVFRKDNISGKKIAFIMMQFGDTKAHKRIINSIRNVLDPIGINGLRADDKQYHDDLFYNIVTYVWGCDFGIAVFDRIEADVFNPNVSLEVGYMLALRKPVCLLKDKTLRTLPTDLIGKIYRKFDPQDPEATIKPELLQWLEDKHIML